MTSSALAEAVERAWSTFSEYPADRACPQQFAYEPGGVRVNFCKAASILGYSALQAALDMPIFVSGPHTKTALSLHQERSFGSYNPVFVRWLVDNGVPAATNGALLQRTQSTYDAHLKVAARAFWFARGYLLKETPRRSAMSASYLGWVKDGGENPTLADWERFPEAAGYEPQSIAASGLTFWIRREADGTAPLFEEGLRKVLAAYDPGFLRASPSPSFSSDAWAEWMTPPGSVAVVEEAFEEDGIPDPDQGDDEP